MRKVIFLLIIILSLPTILWAADPIIETWKLHVEKSKESPNKELIETSAYFIIQQVKFMAVHRFPSIKSFLHCRCICYIWGVFDLRCLREILRESDMQNSSKS